MNRVRLRRMVTVALMAAVISVLSPFAIPVGPVPVTLSLFAVCLTGALLGPLDGSVAVLLYICLGAIGVPVFSGFRAGFSAVFGPTGGYITGYLPCVLMTGLCSRGRLPRLAVGMTLGILLCYLLGTVQFVFVSGATPGKAIALCVLPFLPFDGGKMLCALLLTPSLRRACRLPATRKNDFF